MLEAIKKLIEILKPSDKKKLLGLFLLMFFASVLEVVGLGLILMFVSILSTPEKIFSIKWLHPMLSFFNIVSSKDLLVYGSIALIGLFIFKNTYLLVFNFIQSRFVYNRFKYIANGLFEKYMYAPYAFHLNKNTALLIRNVVTDTILLTSQVMLPILQVLMESIIIIGIAIFLFVAEPLISLAVLVLMGVAGGLLLKLLKKRIKAHGAQAVEHRGQMIKKVNEGLGGLKEIAIQNRQFWFVKEFKYSVNKFAKAQIFNQVAGKSSKPVIETVAIAGMLLIALILVWQDRGVDAVIPVLSLFGAASFKLIPSIDKISNSYNTLRFHSYVLNNIHSDLVDLDVKNLQLAKGDAINKSKFHLHNTLELSKVSYHYPGSTDRVLKDLSCTIKKGESVGFVGPSGAGKTTVIDLVLGLLKPTMGTIKVDGKDISENLVGWQKNIGYIPQFIYLSDNRIRNNIAFGLDEEEIDEKCLLNAIQMARLDEFINKLPQGIDTVVGERGVRLSGGERQRIGIARALYNNPEVLIMDEATSSLDGETEEKIMNAVEQLIGERTVIIISHRLTTIMNCDRFFIIKNGTIIEADSYNELLRKHNKFN
ncbi:MAG: ABC transporter ATP-binding protein [Candidatus Rickettsiella isopodorum]|nr:ABC transporter ATP-binding protein [Candidatus Rickettsiella isopodorum]MDD5342160.1 ABC transporter ATP-binding protein [Patescibacteria group bacterium]